jgi:ligand-binding sensor domain-containing protein/signal transduction histidine kinase
MGTEDGLNKYDGRNFKVYRPDPYSRNCLSYRWIEHILEDQYGILWFGSRGGLTCFNPRTESFIQFIHNKNINNSISNDTITKLLLDNYDYLWVGTFDGLNRVHLTTKELERIEIPGESDLSGRINDLYSDPEGNLWIASDHGLFLFNNQNHSVSGIDLQTGKKKLKNILSVTSIQDEVWIGTIYGLIRYGLHNKNISHFTLPVSITGPSNDQSIEKVFPDSFNNLWIVTSQGLMRFDRQKEKFMPVIKSLDTSHSLSVITVKPICEDSNEYIWFGTFGSGLYRIEPSSGNMIHYQHNPADQKSLSENAINCIYEDRTGRLWFGTFGAGISIYDPRANKFGLVRHDPLDPNSISSNFIWSVFESRSGDLWIGTNDRGLNVYSPQSNTFSYYDHDNSDPHSLSNSTVKRIYEDSNGNIWIGTDGGGLDKFDKRNERFIHFRSDPKDPATISNNSVRGIYEDHNGMLWIGTRDGLNRFDPETQTFKRYLHSDDDPESISNNFIYSTIIQDEKGFLWFGTYGGGLNRMDIDHETFTYYLYDPGNPESISDNVVFSIYEDNDSTFWIGTNNGLDHFNPETGVFRRFGINEGLPNEVIYGVLPDNQDNIWLSTNMGISRFSLTDFSTKNFDVNDGLQSNEFNGGAYHKGYSGKLYFGGVYGLNIIEPDKILPVENVPEVVITKLEILGKEVSILPSSDIQHPANTIIEKDDNFYLTENISFLREIVLDYNHRFLSMEFSALNYPIPEKATYAYQMENLDDEWNYSGERNYVSYANMRSGTYHFMVRAMNPDGIWSDQVTELKITITPPFWESWWFIIIEIIIAAILAFFIYRYLVKVRTNKILRIQNERINRINRKLAESEKNLKEINATKDKFFSIISHDLKNPLTSLLSISESMLEVDMKPVEDEKLSGIRKIHESIRQIHDLLENLLTWSRSQTGRLKFEPVDFNLSKLIEVNLNLHRIPAEKKGIKLTSRYHEEIYAYGDRDMINMVIRNLLNNAVKFTSKDGTINVEVKKDHSTLQVHIKDEGTGIPEEDLDKLFRIDIKFKTTGTTGEKGTGLGLILCKEFVTKNGGTMIVESELNKGSVFGFTLPEGKKE